jgi:hypothetical protein
MGFKLHRGQFLPSKSIMTVLSVDQGFGKIKGTTKKVGINYSPVSVCVFRRDNRQLLWETTSKADGSYAFRNIAEGLECFVVAFDPNEEYNAVVSDKVVAK